MSHQQVSNLYAQAILSQAKYTHHTELVYELGKDESQIRHVHTYSFTDIDYSGLQACERHEFLYKDKCPICEAVKI